MIRTGRAGQVFDLESRTLETSGEIFDYLGRPLIALGRCVIRGETNWEHPDVEWCHTLNEGLT